MYSQSAYPIQRVEGKDTVVVMTKAQALEMNRKFIDMDSTIMQYAQSYSIKYTQAYMLNKELRNRDSVIQVLLKDIEKLDDTKHRKRTDIIMGSFFVVYATYLLTLIQ